MEGFTPWELASLKVFFHRFDNQRKGYLDGDDMGRLLYHVCLTDSSQQGQQQQDGVSSSSSSSRSMDDNRQASPSSSSSSPHWRSDCEAGSTFVKDLMRFLDKDGDVHVSFPEFLGWLGTRSIPSSSPATTTSREELPMEHRSRLFAALVHAESQREDRAALYGGVSLGILTVLKGKFFVWMGMMFYDPIRLFRDTFVDYSTSVREQLVRNAAKKSAAAASDVANLSFLQVLRAHAATEARWLKTGALVLVSVTLDSVVGVAMFVSYAKCRRMIVYWSQQPPQQQQQPIAVCSSFPQWSPSSSLMEVTVTATDALRTFVDRTVQSLTPWWVRQQTDTSQWLCQRPWALEAASGFAGGAVGGFLERPFRYLARHPGKYFAQDLLNELGCTRSMAGEIIQRSRLRPHRPHVLDHVVVQTFTAMVVVIRRSLFQRTVFNVTRNALAHAVFFSVFAITRAWLFQNCFGPRSRFQLELTSWKEALVTATSGCAAGAAFRIVSLPMTNWYKWRRDALWQHSSCALDVSVLSSADKRQMVSKLTRMERRDAVRWAFRGVMREEGLRGVWRKTWQGLGASLAFTMPVTGFAFLIYERTLLAV